MSLFNRSKKSARPSSKKPAFRPSLEALGDRIVPATTWTGPDGGNWNNAANWSAGIPDANDQVTFNTAVTTVMDLPDVDAVVQGISFDAGNAITVNLQNSLRISSAFNLEALSNVGGPVNINGPGAIVFVGGGQYGIGAAGGKNLNIFADMVGSGKVEFYVGFNGSVYVHGDVSVSGTATVVEGDVFLFSGTHVSTPFSVGDGGGNTGRVFVQSNSSPAVDELTIASDGEINVPLGSQLTTADLTLASGTSVDGSGKLALTGSVSATTSAATAEIAIQTQLSGDVVINAGGTAAVDLLFSRAITGTGTATVETGTVRIGGTEVNTYLGTFVVSGSTLELAKPDGVVAIGNAKIGGSLNPSVLRLLNADQIRDGADVTLLEGVNGTFNLNGHNDTINDLTVESGNKVMIGNAGLTTTGTVTLTAGDIDIGANGSLNIAGPMTVNGQGNDHLISVTGGGTLNMTGTARTVNVVGAANTLELNASLFNGTIVKEGAGTIVFQKAGGQLAAIRVNAGTARVNPDMTNAVTLTGGTLAGSGGVGVVAATGGTILPGGGFDPLNTGNLTANAATTFQMDVFGPNDFRQISTTGVVTLNDAILNVTQNNQVPTGTVLALILNDGADAVVGTFGGRPEGSLIVVNGQTLRLSYTGGTGNDVTLTAVTPSQTGLSSSAGVVIRAGLSTNLTAVVTSNANASGSVKFFEGNTLLGEAPVQGGIATLPFAFAEGAHAITAAYGGDADVIGSTSSAVNLNIVPELYAVGAGKGGSSAVTLRNTDGTVRATMNPFADSFTGGVRTATADINGDGYPDLIAGTGPGVATQVKVMDGKTGAEIFSIAPFEAAFTGGVYVAAGDLNGDGKAEFAITPDEGGGPRVRLFDGGTFTPLADYFGIDDPNFRGGARAAFADLNGDGAQDLLLSAGFGGGPRVAGFDGAALAGGNTKAKLFNDFFAFEEGLRNGAFLAGGDLNGDGMDDMVAGGGPGGGPRVTAFSGADLLGNKQTVLANFFAGDPNNRGGVPVGVKQLTADTAADVLAGTGFTGGSKATAYNGEALLKSNTDPLHSFDAFPGFTGGVFVG